VGGHVLHSNQLHCRKKLLFMTTEYDGIIRALELGDTTLEVAKTRVEIGSIIGNLQYLCLKKVESQTIKDGPSPNQEFRF